MEKGTNGLEDRGLATECAKCHREIGAFANQNLALPVIAEPARLEDLRAADLRDGAGERTGIVHRHERRRLDARRRQKLFLGEAILQTASVSGPGRTTQELARYSLRCGEGMLSRFIR